MDSAAKGISIDKRIEELKRLRDERIQSLLTTSDLMNFMEEQYSTFAMSAVKMEFLKRDLMTLIQSPLDLVHYSSLLRQWKESNAAPDDYLVVIEQEIKALVEKYGFEKSKAS